MIKQKEQLDLEDESYFEYECSIIDAVQMMAKRRKEKECDKILTSMQKIADDIRNQIEKDKHQYSNIGESITIPEQLFKKEDIVAEKEYTVEHSFSTIQGKSAEKLILDDKEFCYWITGKQWPSVKYSSSPIQDRPVEELTINIKDLKLENYGNSISFFSEMDEEDEESEEEDEEEVPWEENPRCQ